MILLSSGLEIIQLTVFKLLTNIFLDDYVKMRDIHLFALLENASKNVKCRFWHQPILCRRLKKAAGALCFTGINVLHWDWKKGEHNGNVSYFAKWAWRIVRRRALSFLCTGRRCVLLISVRGAKCAVWPQRRTAASLARAINSFVTPRHDPRGLFN